MSDSNYTGQQGASSTNSPFNSDASVVNQLLGRMNTATVVKIVKVYPVSTNAYDKTHGIVDVQPLVNQIDGPGNQQAHDTVYGVSYARIQGGKSAFIHDPVAGDIGIAVFANRDISSVVANKAQANPGSRRRFSMSDGLYIGGLLNGAPTTYVMVDDTNGVTIVTPKNMAVTVQGNASITVTGTNTVTAPTTAFVGNITATGSIIAGFGGADQVGVQTHGHPTTPDGPVAPPIPGWSE